jgi:hypothetical protein
MVLLMLRFLLVKRCSASVFHVEIILGVFTLDLMGLVVTVVLFVADLGQLFDSLDWALLYLFSGLISELIRFLIAIIKQLLFLILNSLRFMLMSLLGVNLGQFGTRLLNLGLVLFSGYSQSFLEGVKMIQDH